MSFRARRRGIWGGVALAPPQTPRFARCDSAGTVIPSPQARNLGRRGSRPTPDPSLGSGGQRRDCHSEPPGEESGEAWLPPPPAPALRLPAGRQARGDNKLLRGDNMGGLVTPPPTTHRPPPLAAAPGPRPPASPGGPAPGRGPCSAGGGPAPGSWRPA